jgi:PAS domain S-box-containing protein
VADGGDTVLSMKENHQHSHGGIIDGPADGAVADRVRAQEAFYRNIVEGAADVTTVMAPDGTILYASSSISEPTSLGYSRAEVVGRNTLDIIHPEDREKVAQAMARDLAGHPTTVEARVHKRDGTLMWAEMRGKATFGIDGKQIIVACSRDISERKRLQERLKKSEEYYKSLLRGSSDLITVIDESGALIFVSDSAEKILGYRPEEALGRQIFSYIHPDDLPLAWTRFTEATDQNSPLTELRVRRKDGTWSFSEGTGRAVTSPDGRKLVLIITRDISERKQIEREHALLAAIVESSDDAIVSNSLDQRIMTWNKGAERLFGFSAAEAIGQPASMYMPPEWRKWGEVFLDELKTRLDQAQSFEVPCLCKDGRVIDVWTVCGAIRDRHAKLIGFSAIHRDLTERKRADREEALLAALVKSSEDAISSLDTDFRITSWNRGAQRLLGYTAEEAIGKRPFDLYVPEADCAQAQAVLAHDLDLMRKDPEAMRQLEVPLRRKDGVPIVVTIVGCGIHDSNGKLIGLSNIMRDVTERRRIERQTAELAAIVNASDDAIIGFSKDLRMTTWNPAAERLYGYSAAEAIGQGFDLFVPADQLPQALAADRRLLETGVPETFEQVSQRKDGSSSTSLVNIFPIRDPEGNIIGGAGIGHDITERKRIEGENAALAAIVESSDDAISSIGPDLRITYWNRGAERMFGFTAEESIGRLFTENIAPEDRARSLEIFDRLMARPDEVIRFEGPHHRKDGTLIEASTVCFAIRDADGKVVALSSIQRDVTERRNTERQNGALAAIVNASHDAIIDVSTEARIISWNPAAEKLYGYSAEEAIGKGVDLFVPPAELADTASRHRRVVETGQPLSWEQHGHRKDGTAFVSAVNIFPILDAARKIISVAGIGRDITALKETERQLVAAREAAFAASQAKSEFLSSMSHEIRTPMTAILGMAELIGEGELNEEQRRYIEILDNNGRALLDLINSILDLAKIESGRLTLERVGFDLGEVVIKATQTLAFRAHAKGIELNVSIAPDVPTSVLGDPLRLRQVLINLIGNAIKFTEQGEVLVSVERDSAPAAPTRLKFSVHDTGIGIPKDKLPLLFATFSQADSSTARKYGGSGLGLAIVKRLVNLMHGEVSLESEFGKGSTFSFTSPFELDPSPTIAAPPWPHLSQVPALLVVGNQTERAILRGALSARGASVTEVASYEEGAMVVARAVQEIRPPRFVLLDARIGSPNEEAMKQLIVAASTCGAAIIAMIRSDNLAADTARLKSLKLDSYLIKPIDLRELAKALRHAIVGGENTEAPTVRSEITIDSPTPSVVDRPIKILFADDSIDNRILIRMFLKKTPYHLDEVENGRQAIDRFIAEGDYDLVLMDIQMPEVDGYVATRAIRNWERDHNHTHTPIVALTASVFPEAIRQTRAAGCDGHLGKPINKKTLLGAIRDTIASCSRSA